MTETRGDPQAMRGRAVFFSALLALGLTGGAIASAQSVTVCAEAHVTVAGETVVDQDRTCQTVSPETVPTP